jgi:hypothetical protein
VAKIKGKESNPDLENTDRIQIIDAYQTDIVATTTIQSKEPIDPKEGEHLFHS